MAPSVPPRPAPAGDIPPALISALFHSTSDGIYAVDRQRRLIAVNPAAAAALGVAGDEVLGRPCWEVFRTTLCRDHCPLLEALATGRPTVNRLVEILAADGRAVPVALSCSLLRDADGRLLGGVESFRNLDRMREIVMDAERDLPLPGIATREGQMKHLFAILPTIAASESSVLLNGETGTGKSLIARTIHRLSPRRDGPLVTVNCGALPETLLESEIFGYRAGAFTGAVRDRRGRIAAAEGGTLFLDEIGDMSPGMQVKLLRFLQDHVYEPLGDDRPLTADVRVLAATHRDLAALVADGTFREDLYYRINVLSLEMPPLRERRRDIPLLAQACLDRLVRQRGKACEGITPAAFAVLAAYPFPGNIRELENVIEHAYVLCRGPVIDVAHLPARLTGGRGDPATGHPARSLADVEAEFLLAVLERHGGHRQRAADELGIHKSTLLRRARRLGIEMPREDGRAGRAGRAGQRAGACRTKT